MHDSMIGPAALELLYFSINKQSHRAYGGGIIFMKYSFDHDSPTDRRRFGVDHSRSRRYIEAGLACSALLFVAGLRYRELDVHSLIVCNCALFTNSVIHQPIKSYLHRKQLI